MHKIFDNMLTDELKFQMNGKHFQEEEKKEGISRGRKKKEGRDGVRQACPTMTYPNV